MGRPEPVESQFLVERDTRLGGPGRPWAQAFHHLDSSAIPQWEDATRMISRRRMLNSALLTTLIGLRVVGGSKVLGAAPAAPRAPLDEQDPAAKAVVYQQDARKVDPRQFPNYRRGQSCATCALIEFGTAPLRGCSLFPGKLVAAAGWCSVWQLRGGKS